MNKEHLQLIFDQYISRFDELDDPDGNNEGYKWRAVSCFMENWDIDADDFASMFKSSMKDTSNLIDNATVQPIGGILLLLKHPEEIEFVRKCFRDLYTDDGGNLEARQEKINRFIEQINPRIDRYATGSWKYPQKFNNVLYYLNLRYPSENYIYKATEAVEWANCIEFGDDFGSGETFSLPKYYRMCDELLSAVSENDEILDLQSKRLERDARGFDDELHILVYDIIYCAHTYNFYSTGMIQTTSTKERIKKAQLRDEIDSLETKLAETEQLLRQLENDAAEVVNMVGQIVEHRQFGKGTIISQTKDIQLIAFSTGEKKFQFPAAYVTGFLKADEAAMKSIRKKSETEQRIKSTKNMITALTAQIKKLKKEN